MAVIIENMDMPNSCKECRFFYYRGRLCKDTMVFLNAECTLLYKSIGRDITKSYHYPYKSAQHTIDQLERWKDCPIREYREEEHDDGSNN